MAYIKFSNNPYNRNTGDCVIRALSVALKKTWDDTFWELAGKAYEMGDVLASNSVWGEYLRDIGFARRVIPNSCPECYSVAEFALDHPYVSSTTIIISNTIYGASVSGTLSIAHTIPGFMGGVVALLCGVYYPLITNLVAKNDKEGLIKLIQKTQMIIGIIVFAIIIVFSLYSNLFFGLWVPEENSQYLSLISFIYLIPYFFTSCFWICTFVFTAMNKVMIPAIVSVASGVISVAIQFIIGKAGANPIFLPLTCTIITCACHGVFLPLYLKKVAKIEIRKMYLVPAKIAIVSILIAGLTFVIQTNVHQSSWVGFILFGGGTGIVALLVYSVLLLPNEIVNLISSIKRKRKK